MADGTLASDRRTGQRFGLFALACVLLPAAYVALAARRGQGESAQTNLEHTPAAVQATTTRAAVSIHPAFERLLRGPRVYYRSLRGGERGRIVVASLDALEEHRWVTGLRCDRAHFQTHFGLCARSEPTGSSLRVSVELLGPALEPTQRFELEGVPSRVRVAADERFAALTLFVTGDDYAAAFSTRTKLFALQEGRLQPDIEFYDALHGGEPFQRLDFNYWGITFARDSRRAYATLGTGGTTYLVQADLEQRRVQTLRENVECPSLSPSGTRLAYKKRVGPAGEWRLHWLELASLCDHPLAAEPRNIDDQVEWLDEDHLLYAAPSDPERPELGTDIWVSPIAAELGPSRVFLRGAASPAIVR